MSKRRHWQFTRRLHNEGVRLVVEGGAHAGCWCTPDTKPGPNDDSGRGKEITPRPPSNFLYKALKVSGSTIVPITTSLQIEDKSVARKDHLRRPSKLWIVERCDRTSSTRARLCNTFWLHRFMTPSKKPMTMICSLNPSLAAILKEGISVTTAATRQEKERITAKRSKKLMMGFETGFPVLLVLLSLSLPVRGVHDEALRNSFA